MQRHQIPSFVATISSDMDLLDRVNVAALALEQDLTILAINQSAVKLLLISSEQWVGQSFHELCSQLVIDFPVLDNFKYGENNSGNECQTTIIVNGQLKQLVWSVSEKVLLNRNDSYIFISINDISNLNQGVLESIMAALPGNVYWKDKEGKYLGCNTNTLNYLELKSESELLGKSDYELQTRTVAKNLGTNDLKVISTGRPIYNIEEPSLKNLGNVFLTNKVPMENEKGEIIGLLGISIDITERERLAQEVRKAKEKAEHAEKKLQQFLLNMKQEVTGENPDPNTSPEKHASEMRKYLENIIDCMPGNVYWKDKQGRYLGGNINTVKYFNLSSKKDLVGKTDYELIEKNIADSIRKVDLQVIKNNKPLLLEEINTEEPKIYFLSRKVPLHDNEGRPIGMVGISVDVTEKKQLEKKLLESKAREERLKVLSSMGGMIAHELRTPLAGITFGMSTVITRLSKLIEVYKDWSARLDEIPIKYRHIDQLQSVCEDIELSLQQIDNTIDTVLAGFRPSQVSDEQLKLISVDTLFQDLLKQYPLTKFEAKVISVKNNPGLVIQGIERVLLHILSNLVKNAFYFIQEVGKGEITLWADKDKDFIKIYVQDTAKGIPKDQLEKIFDPYFTTKDTAESIGMGLYFCKLAIEALNGQISCDSIEGEKTVFTLVLPIGDNRG